MISVNLSDSRALDSTRKDKYARNMFKELGISYKKPEQIRVREKKETKEGKQTSWELYLVVFAIGVILMFIRGEVLSMSVCLIGSVLSSIGIELRAILNVLKKS